MNDSRWSELLGLAATYFGVVIVLTFVYVYVPMFAGPLLSALISR
jgi:hypothetical protein